MPKPIKKRLAKKIKPEEEVMNFYERSREYFSSNTIRVQIILAVFLVIVISVVAAVFYVKKTSVKAARLQYDAYKLYTAAISEDNTALFEQSLEKFKNAYDYKKLPFLIYYEADIYQRLGDLDKSMRTLNSLIETYPSDNYLLPLSYTKLGMLYIRKQDYENALKTFQSLEESKAPAYKDLAMYQKAKIYRKMGEDEKTNQYYNELKEQFPDSPYTKEVEVELKALEEKGKQDKSKEKAD